MNTYVDALERIHCIPTYTNEKKRETGIIWPRGWLYASTSYKKRELLDLKLYNRIRTMEQVIARNLGGDSKRPLHKRLASTSYNRLAISVTVTKLQFSKYKESPTSTRNLVRIHKIHLKEVSKSLSLWGLVKFALKTHGA